MNRAVRGMLRRVPLLLKAVTSSVSSMPMRGVVSGIIPNHISPSEGDMCFVFTESSHLECFKYANKQGYELNAETCQSVAAGCNLECGMGCAL